VISVVIGPSMHLILSTEHIHWLLKCCCGFKILGDDAFTFSSRWLLLLIIEQRGNGSLVQFGGIGACGEKGQNSGLLNDI
jgi:hypothetical protein